MNRSRCEFPSRFMYMETQGLTNEWAKNPFTLLGLYQQNVLEFPKEGSINPLKGPLTQYFYQNFANKSWNSFKKIRPWIGGSLDSPMAFVYYILTNAHDFAQWNHVRGQPLIIVFFQLHKQAHNFSKDVGIIKREVFGHRKLAVNIHSRKWVRFYQHICTFNVSVVYLNKWKS